MALPKLIVPEYELTLPISKKMVTFRPFTVREQKILLLAVESNEEDTMEKSMRQIIKNCCLSDVEIDSLPLIDIEYFFIQLRAKSIGEIVDVRYQCGIEVSANGTTKTCGNIMEASVNLLELKVENLKEDFDVIRLNDKIGLKMKMPEYSILPRLNNLTNKMDVLDEAIFSCVEYIFDEDNIYPVKDISKDYLRNFFDDMDTNQYRMIEKFFKELPSLKKTLDIKCSRCGYDHKIEVNGIESFFS